MSGQSVPDPMACSHPSNFGPVCDLRSRNGPGHGGAMHSGFKDGWRVWWDEDGQQVTFGQARRASNSGVVSSACGVGNIDDPAHRDCCLACTSAYAKERRHGR